MGKLEDVRPQIRRAAQQAGLRRRLDVTRQQQALAGDLDAHHQGAVVARNRGRRRRRPQRGDREIAETARRVAGAALPDGKRVGAGGLAQRGEPRLGARAAGNPQSADGERLEHGRNAAAMIQIGVGREQQIEMRHAERTQRRNHGAAPEIGPAGHGHARVDEQRRAPALHQRRISLTHVEERGASGAVF
jgi:hypothetical protein